jgi:acetyltransferase-like isoleucine patch superfamily enzyme
MFKKISLITRIVIQFPKEFYGSIISNINGPIGNQLRIQYFKSKGVKIGRNVIIDTGVSILNPKSIFIGDNTWIDKNSILIAGLSDRSGRKTVFLKNNNYKFKRGELIIGKNVHIAPYSIIIAHGGVHIGNNLGIASGSKIYSITHDYKDPDSKSNNIIYKFTPMVPLNEQIVKEGPIVINDNTAIALNSIILPGVTIGKNSWIGPLSLVTNDIPQDVVARGFPAKVIRKIR